MCREVKLDLHDSHFLIDFHLFKLEGCDAVIGVQWLRTLGKIIWDFETMEMEFTVRGQKICLVGMILQVLR